MKQTKVIERGDRVTIALAGNPNSGKTSLFNALTGARQHVGNYPGVTVEKKEGTFQCRNKALTLVDLPGTYSLTSMSIEEVVARDFVIKEKPDVVVDVIDASNIERNLYLAVQFIELGVPLILAFNMSDVAQAKGLEFDIKVLSERLGVPIVTTIGHKGLGLEELKDAILSLVCQNQKQELPTVHYGRELDEEIDKIQNLVVANKVTSIQNKRWLALKLLENDREVNALLPSESIQGACDQAKERILSLYGDQPEIIIADHRYGFISGVCQETVKSTVEARHDMSDMIDAVVTHRYLGIPVFFGLMYLVFYLTFTVGEIPMGWIEAGFSWLAKMLASLWPVGTDSALRSLLIDGVIGGVGGVIVFLPNILFLFLTISILEDSGYMSRAAFIMDHFMHKIGLHGKSFIPMLTGFGCSVPAIMATRTLENERDRITTMMVIPLMSCGARLPIYALIIPAFFPLSWQAPMLWLIYFIGILLAVIAAKVLRLTVLKGESTPFVMELPPYRMPTLKSVLLHMWERGVLYLKKAGTVILAISIVMWAMTSYPKVDTVKIENATPEQVQALELSNSMAGRIGQALEPIMSPMGFDWKINTALIGAFAAKEVFVSQMGIVYSIGSVESESGSLRQKLAENYSPLVGFCIMLFCLIATPCMATVVITRRESGSWKWAMFQFVGLTILAYVLTVIVYQVGSLVASVF